MNGYQRVCFRLQVDPARLDEYRQRHAAVWPDMLSALAASGWHNYSLFLDDDGLLIGYFETPSLEAALAGMAATEVNRRWQDEMAGFFVDLDRPADQWRRAASASRPHVIAPLFRLRSLRSRRNRNWTKRAGRPIRQDPSFVHLAEVFHLESQLAAVPPDKETP